MIGHIFMGQFEVIRPLGAGGMARVYLARQFHPPRQVVIKVIHEDIVNDPKSKQRFERETELLHRFQHPGIANMLDASLDDPLGPCIIMEYVRGIGMDQLLAKNGRFTPARVGRFINQICDTLDAAHNRGIIHRDLKPSNLMLVDADSPFEKIKVLDFGLAKLNTPDSDVPKITETNVEFGVGTPNYISPEQARGEAVDHRADIYSLGVVAYELLAGQLPFIRSSDMDVLLAHATETPPSFAELGLDGCVPKAVEAVVMSCLAKDPNDRPQSALEMSERFDTALVTPDEPLDDEPLAPPVAVIPANPDEVQFSFEAWMPQRVAIMKLRGFVQNHEGTIVASEPGRILVQLGRRKGRLSSTALSWFGVAPPPDAAPIELDMHLEQSDPDRENRLQVTAIFRPLEAVDPQNVVWRDRCNTIYCDLRSYLMGH